MTPLLVPPVPALPADLVDAHGRAHAELAARLRSADPETARAFTALQHRLVVDSLVHLQPVVASHPGEPLLPPPRAFLTPVMQRRQFGAEVAFRHLDSRAAMQQAGVVASALDATTPFALHALFEGPGPSGVETNPGRLRATPGTWAGGRFTPPPASDVPELFSEVMRFALEVPAPAVARAAWLTFATLCIHPFVDGNGRTSRALFMGLTSDELPLGVDWGIVEQWSVHRIAYVEATLAGVPTGPYRADRLDPLPFMLASTAASIAGVDLCTRRLDAVGAALRAIESLRPLPRDGAAVVLVADVWRSASLAELDALGRPRDELLPMCEELVDLGALAWVRRPASRRTLFDASEWALAAGPV